MLNLEHNELRFISFGLNFPVTCRSSVKMAGLHDTLHLRDFTFEGKCIEEHTKEFDQDLHFIINWTAKSNVTEGWKTKDFFR